MGMIDDQMIALDFLNQETVLGLLVGILVGLLAYFAVSKLIGVRRSTKVKSAIEWQFRNVFSIMDEGRRQSLIGCYMEKYECGCEEAMRRAVDELRRDANRWYRAVETKKPGPPSNT